MSPDDKDLLIVICVFGMLMILWMKFFAARACSTCEGRGCARCRGRGKL